MPIMIAAELIFAVGDVGVTRGLARTSVAGIVAAREINRKEG